MPVLTTAAIRNVLMRERSAREWKMSLSMLMGSDRAISFADCQCFRSMDAHETDVRFCGRFDERTTMLVPFYEFPMIPPVVAGVVPPLSLAVRLPRVAYYFGNMEKSQGADVRERYEGRMQSSGLNQWWRRWGWTLRFFAGSGFVIRSVSVSYASSSVFRISSSTRRIMEWRGFRSRRW